MGLSMKETTWQRLRKGGGWSVQEQDPGRSCSSHRLRSRFLGALLVVLAFAGGNVRAAVNLDGDFEALEVGLAPNIDMPAGHWFFPSNYVAAGVAETNAAEFTIVNDIINMGTCLQLNADASMPGNQHLPNVFVRPVGGPSERELIVDFDIAVMAFGTDYGGGGVYLGNGGPLSGVRGPQLVWNGNGDLDAVDGAGNLVVVARDYPRWVWQSVRLLVHMGSATFDVLSAPTGSPLVLLATGLSFRGGPQSSFDRITVARFASMPNVSSYFDNFQVEVAGGPQWVIEPKCVLASDTSGTLTGLATGTPPLTYLWWDEAGQLFGVPLATGPTLSTWSYPGEVRYYWLTVSNQFGQIGSGAVAWLVDPPGVSLFDTRVGNGTFSFSFLPYVGLEHVTETKPAMDASWMPVATNVGSAGNGLLRLSFPMTNPATFYRVQMMNER
jgi:hypothetical protein